MVARRHRAMMDAVADQGLPSGVVTFVFTDIVGSTRLWERAPAEMETALARHGEIVTTAMAAHAGVVLRERGEGDSTFSVFTRASDAVAAAYVAQAGIEAEPWPPGARLSVRFAVHTGESVERDGDFLGPAVNRAARLRAVARGGEVLVSESTARLVADRLPTGVRLVELGELHLRDLDRPEPTYILAGPGLPQPQPTPDRRTVSSADALGECGGDGSDEQASPEPGGLTTPVTSLVDRQVELSKLSSLLRRHRLVTLIGAGGVGKTRLATHVAGRARENGLGDAWWAELTGVTGDDDTAVVILDALGVRGASDMDASERIARNLAVRRGVLVLDNCEHVRTPVGAICDMVLKRAPSVRILATSREPLGVIGEVLLPVPPLRAPSDDAPETIAASDAVRLFVDRATTYNPEFALGRHNALAVAELCRSLDGLPLAIELAAARVTTMTPQEIVARLDHLFRILGRRSDHIDHHRTLHATIDWSYRLLEADERALLSRLVVFAPGFSLAAVEAVSQVTPQGRDVLDVLAGLVDKSMLVAEVKGGMTRLRLLETVRAYLLERVEQSGGQDDIRQRHVAFYTRLAEDLAGPTVVANVGARDEQLAAEAPNIRVALVHAVETDDASATFALTAALVDVWCLRGWGGAILGALESALDNGECEPSVRADAFATAAWSAWSQGRHSKAVACCDQSERCSSDAGRPPPARVQFVRGLSRLLDDGDIPGGMNLCERGLHQLRRSGHLRRYAHDLAAYGSYLAIVGETSRSHTVSAESVALAGQLGDRHSLAMALAASGYTSIETDPERARAHFAEVVAIGDPWCAGSALWALGWLADRASDDSGALGSYGRALELWGETGDWRGIYYAIQGIATVATRVGRFTTAVRFFAGAEGLAADIGSGSMPSWNAWRDRQLERLRDALSPVEFEIGWMAGDRLEPDVLVKEALIESRRTSSATD
jgi:predicted ATPase/class 3 adenylate cyclase